MKSRSGRIELMITTNAMLQIHMPARIPVTRQAQQFVRIINRLQCKTLILLHVQIAAGNRQ